MRSTIIPIAGLSLLLAGGAIAAPQDAAKADDAEAKITYAPVLADALAKAKEGKQPILVVVVAGEDEDRANLTKLLESEKVKKLSAHFQVLVAAEGVHGGSEDGNCSAFDGLKCADHDAVYADIQKKKLLAGTRRVPEFIFLNEKGKTIFKRGFGFEGGEGDELARRMNIALGIVNEANVDAELAESERFRMEVLIQNARDRDPERRKAAAVVLGNSDDPKLLKVVARSAKTTGSAPDRAEIYAALGIKGNWSALDILRGGLGDKDTAVRLLAIDAMEKVAMPDAAPDLMKHSGREKKLLPAAMAVKSSCYLDPMDKKVIANALAKSKHNRVTLRIGACWGMSQMVGNKQVYNRLLTILRTDKEVNARAAAAWALGYVGDQAAAELIAKQREQEREEIEVPRNVMAAAVNRIAGSQQSDYAEMIEQLLAIEAVEDFSDGKDNSKWGKWAKWAGKAGKGWGKGGWGGGWGGKGGGGWGGKGGGWGGKGGKGR